MHLHEHTLMNTSKKRKTDRKKRINTQTGGQTDKVLYAMLGVLNTPLSVGFSHMRTPNIC